MLLSNSTTNITFHIQMQSNLLLRAAWFSSANERINAGAGSRPCFYRKPSSGAAIASQASVATKRNVTSMMAPNKKQTKQRLITISTGEGRWQGKWMCDYVFSFRKLQLMDLLHDVKNDSDIFVSLCIESQAGLGLSVEGSVSTCFNTSCYNCCTPFSREIESTFKVWIIPLTRQVRGDPSKQIPVIGGDDDPSVLYVKPGQEADLDTVVRDTIRLATSVVAACSESCEEAESELLYVDPQDTPAIDMRWHKLLELKKRL